MRAAGLVALLVAFVGCASTAPVPDPDLDGMEPQVVDVLQRGRQAVLEHRSSAEIWGELGSAYDAHGLMAEAEVCYRRALTLAPDDFRWAHLLAVVREIQGAETEEVVALFEQAATLRPDYAPIPLRLGDALSLRGEHEAAAREFRKAVRLDPDGAVAHRGLGQVLLALGKTEEALQHFERAIELEPRDRTAHVGLAQALMRMGEIERARQVTERSRDLLPVSVVDDPVYGRQVYSRSISSSRAFSRSMARIRDGEFEAAIADLKLVLQARPDDASAHYWIGTAYQGLEQWKPAIEHLSRAVELEPTMAPARARLAEARGQVFTND